MITDTYMFTIQF